MARKKKTSESSYSADRPIRSRKGDLLGRAKFAEELAADLQLWEGTDSLVVALYGKWGSGKTSVKNMVLEANHSSNSNALPVLEFNPWQLSGIGNIPMSFFRELGIALNTQGPQRDIAKRAASLKVYASTLSLAGTAIESIGKIFPWIGFPAGPVVEAAGKGVKAIGQSAKAGSEALKAEREAKQQSLQDQKNSVTKALSGLPQPLLVVIDDIDRLTTEEILQVFQLVKANADFPRLIYLLLFEREIVAKALNAVSGDKGNEFLEKIVQVGYHIPEASRAAIQKTLFDGLNSHLADDAVAKRWDKRRWTDVYSGGIASYFRNLRHVYRFLSSLAFHVSHYKADGSFEVNPVDLIGLEVLRVFEPDVYERLAATKVLLTRYQGSQILFGEIQQEAIDEAISEITSRASTGNQTVVKKILELLFPPIGSSFDSEVKVTSRHAEWMRDLRVCHPDIFPLRRMICLKRSLIN